LGSSESSRGIREAFPSRRIAFPSCSSTNTLLEWKTVAENILLPFTLLGHKITAGLREKATGVLGLVGLERHENYYPSQISGGMKKKSRDRPRSD